MDEHMETLASAPMKTYFGGGHLRDRGLMELIGGKRRQAPPPFLDFPVDIARDWAVAIGQFHDWIQQEQRSVLGGHGTDTNGVPDHWPEEAPWLLADLLIGQIHPGRVKRNGHQGLIESPIVIIDVVAPQPEFNIS